MTTVVVATSPAPGAPVATAAPVAVAPARPALVVPSDALIRTGGATYLFIDHGDGHLEPRSVAPGACWDDLCDLLEGVAAGDHVVSGATFLIDAESRLRAAITPRQPPAP